MRQIFINRLLFIVVAMFGLSLTSCLKDKGFEDGEYGMNGDPKPFISLPFAKNRPNTLSLESKNALQTIDLFSANLEYVNPAASPITVTVEVDNALVTNMLPGVTVLPAGVFTITSTDLVIPAGARLSNQLQLKINTGTLDPTKAYGVGFKIKSVSNNTDVASNLKEVVYQIALKNKWDGVYHVTGPMVDVANAALTNWTPYWVAHLVTTGPNTCDIYDMSYTGGVYHPIKSNGANSYYGTFGMHITFDPATDKIIDMVSPYEPAANTRTARLDPSGVNQQQANKNILLKYFMYQPSVVASGPRTTFDELFTYQGPRP
jgi:hypothetical protein